jgi:hypothetical protein
MRLGDSTKVGQGNVPLRYGLSAAYDGVPGAVFTVRAARENWTDLKGLGSAGLGLNDATDLAVGAEVAGPRTAADGVVMLRLGYRNRGSPFLYDGHEVKESSVGGGVGIPLGATRAFVDIGLSRVSRTSATIKENAWLLSIGVGIKP